MFEAAPTEHAANRKVSMPLIIGIALLPIVFAWFLLRNGYSSLARLLGFGWLAVAAMIAVFAPAPPPNLATSGKGNQGTQKVVDQEPRALPVTTVELERAYAENEVAAQEEFGERELAVTGIVATISLDISNRPMITFVSDNSIGPTASFDKDASKQIAKIRRGQTVTVRCSRVGEILGRPVLTKCEP